MTDDDRAEVARTNHMIAEVEQQIRSLPEHAMEAVVAALKRIGDAEPSQAVQIGMNAAMVTLLRERIRRIEEAS